LRQLADGRFRSGEELARTLACRAARCASAWSALETLGVECHRVRGRGCRLPQALDLLDAGMLTAELQGSGLHVDLVDHACSTSADLLARADTLASGHVRIAEWQTAGRRRRGRRWLALPVRG
jgi:BirA family biotin operon repressor/biotin-[acetyl-CoA-carboxylase] ligase